MKNITLAILAASFALLAFSYCAAVPEMPKIAVINIREAIAATEEGRAAATDFQKTLKDKQDELNARQAAFKKLKGKAAIQDGAKLREFVATTQKYLDDRIKNTNAALWRKMRLVIQDMASEGKFDLILNDQDDKIVYARSTLDLTTEAANEYDKAARFWTINEKPVIN